MRRQGTALVGYFGAKPIIQSGAAYAKAMTQSPAIRRLGHTLPALCREQASKQGRERVRSTNTIRERMSEGKERNNA